MNKKFLVYSLVGLLSSGAIVGFVLVDSQQGQSFPASGKPQQPKSVRVDQHFIEMGQGMMNMATDLNALKQAPDFDKEFVRQMIPHHQMAVKMAQMVSSRAARPEIRTLAQSIIKSQNAEIAQMQGWQQAWN
jgi:uncharacterized protein (DUF305 family)